MKKILCTLIACILFLGVTGCSDKTTGKSVTLKLGIPGGQTVTPASIVDGFISNHPNVKVEIDETPWNEFKNKLKMQIAASNPPDVFIMDSGYVATLGGMGAALDLSGKIKENLNESDYSQALFAGKDKDGNVWGIPHSLNSVAILYNKRIFDKYNVSYPEEDWTFEDMMRIAKKLTVDEDKDSVTDIYGLATGTSITDGWLPFVLAAGGSPLDENYENSNFGSEKTIEGFKKFLLNVQNGISPSIEWISANGNVNAAFYNGKVAMIMCQLSNIMAINNNASPDFEYDAQMLPIGWDNNRHCVYVPNQWTIFSKTSSEAQSAAWDWIEHFLSEESQSAVAKLENKLPIRKTALEEVANTVSVPKNKAAFFKGIENHGVTLFESPSWEEWRPQVEVIVAQMYNGVKSVDEGLVEIDKLVKDIIANE